MLMGTPIAWLGLLFASLIFAQDITAYKGAEVRLTKRVNGRDFLAALNWLYTSELPQDAETLLNAALYAAKGVHSVGAFQQVVYSYQEGRATEAHVLFKQKIRQHDRGLAFCFEPGERPFLEDPFLWDQALHEFPYAEPFVVADFSETQVRTPNKALEIVRKMVPSFSLLDWPETVIRLIKLRTPVPEEFTDTMVWMIENPVVSEPNPPPQVENSFFVGVQSERLYPGSGQASAALRSYPRGQSDGTRLVNQ